MNLLNELIHRKTYFAFAFALIAHCSEKPFYSCDLYSNNHCLITENDIYLVPKPNQTISSFTDLSHYLYFHSKITPGLRVNKSALLNETPKECWYRLSDPTGNLKPVEGHLEGFRIDNNGIWCFDYFGTFLLKFVRLNKIENQPADLSLFPLKLEIGVTTGQEPGPKTQRFIQLKLDGWQFSSAQ